MRELNVNEMESVNGGICGAAAMISSGAAQGARIGVRAGIKGAVAGIIVGAAAGLMCYGFSGKA